MVRSIWLATLIGLFSFMAMADSIAQKVFTDLTKLNNFTPRETWGAMEITAKRAKTCNLESDVSKNTIVVLSTKSSANRKGVDCPEAVEGAYTRRTDATFCGIGTNFVVDADGMIYQGRELQHKAACSVPNTGVIGITLAGCFDEDECSAPVELNDAMNDALVTLVAVLSHHYNFEINRQNVLPISRRTSAANFRSSPGSLVTAQWSNILAGAKAKQQELYGQDDSKEL